MRLLLAEDEKPLSKALTAILERNNYSVDAVYDGEEALEYLDADNYDGVILDIMMPKVDGITVLKTIRNRGNLIPVLLLTAKSEVDDKVAGLDAGANDYLAKPFHSKELLARIRAMTRTQTAQADSKLQIGNVTLDRATFELSTPAGSFRLANKEFQMLELMMSNPSHLISAERFMEKIWGYDSEAEVNVVWVYISYLRKKLRMKLIIASMISLLAVLLIIEGIAGALNYNRIVAEADQTLEILEENNGKFPDVPPPEKPSEKKKEGRMSSELPYESRYFSVLLDSEGEVLTTDTGKIARIDTSDAVEYAKKVLKSGKERGFLEGYRYVVVNSDSEVRVIFLDCSRNLSTFQNFIVTAVVVSTAGLLAVLILMIFLSARIVKPFSENYEKQKRFITDAGHELKTPLTIIDADAEVLEMDFGENEWLSDIQSQTRRLADLTNNLILLSRMEEERTKELMVDFPLSDIAEETVGTFQALAKTQNKVLESNITPMIAMKGDEKAIRRLITILLDNAVKYAKENGRICVTLEKQKKRIRLSVFNTTEQISKEHMEHLFDRFYRTDRSRNSETGGYGLGLSIAAATVEAHRGKITATTEDEKSLLITVIFPIS